jgi:hypothetical protein
MEEWKILILNVSKFIDDSKDYQSYCLEICEENKINNTVNVEDEQRRRRTKCLCKLIPESMKYHNFSAKRYAINQFD